MITTVRRLRMTGLDDEDGRSQSGKLPGNAASVGAAAAPRAKRWGANGRRA